MKKKHIFLTILPYWSPVIPPAGLSVLKSFLQPYGYTSRIIDFNTKRETLSFYYDYFDALKKYIPPENRGTFYNMGHEILEKHLIAYQKYQDEKKYFKLAKLLIYNTYYVDVDDQLIIKLNKIIKTYLDDLWEYFLFQLDYEKPDVVGITLYKTTLPLSLYVLKLVKTHYPHIKTVVGGGIFTDSHKRGTPNFSDLLKETRSYIDKVIIGDGEELFLKYLEGKLPDEKRVFTQQDLDPSEILSLEEKSLPDFSDISMLKYSHLVATASKSCPYSCSFCNEKEFFGPYRKKNPAKTVEDMMTLYKKHQRKLFFMTDSLLNPVIDDLAAEVIKNRAPVYMDTYFRIDKACADPKRTLHWRRGGLYRVRIGVESGSDKMLEIMNKGITVAQIRAALPKLAMAGIKTTTYWLMGHPYETEEDFQQTLNLVEELKDFIWQAECNAFRYYYGAHNADDAWQKHRQLLYPEELAEMLVFDTHTLNIKPTRKEAFDRLFRFINHCNRLGIPNPYSGYEGYEADKRWRELHKNAVPTLEEMEDEGFFDKGRKILLADNLQQPLKDFNF